MARDRHVENELSIIQVCSQNSRIVVLINHEIVECSSYVITVINHITHYREN